MQPSNVTLMEYRRGRITQVYRRWGYARRERDAKLLLTLINALTVHVKYWEELFRFGVRGGQTGSFPFSEASSHYEPSESCETNIRKRPVCPRVRPRVPGTDM